MNFFIVFPVLVVGSLATNFCDKSLCRERNGQEVKHIGCGHSGKMADICQNGESFEGATFQKEILHAINSLRSNFASGKAAGFSPALRMAELSWDPELAYLALLNVKQCDMEHDACHNTDAFKYSGQNLAWSASTGKIDIKQAIIAGIQGWYDEIKDCTPDVLAKYYSKGGPVTGHFTALVCDRHTKVGCAYSTYTTEGGKWKNFLLACNFASTNMIGYPIVKSSTIPGSGCSTKSETYSGLCGPTEPIDANKFEL